MGVLKRLLDRRPSTALRAKLESVGEWALEEQSVATVLPFLISSVLIPNNRKEGADPALIHQDMLFAKLRDIYESQLSRHLGNEPLRFDSPTLSRYKNGQSTEPDRQLPLAFLIWLSEAIDAKRFSESSPAMRLLAVFNPVSAAEAFLVSGEALPQFEAASRHSPLLRSTIDREIDAAERKVSEGLKTLLGLKEFNAATVRDDFYGSGGGRPAAKATFLVYRRAVEAGQISKAFLVIEPPARASDLHSFTLWRRATSGVRESRGFILSLRSHHVFVGATGAQRGGSERVRPLLTDALKCIIVNRDHGIWDNAIWPGLTLTHGPTLVPVAARCVLVRARHDHSSQADLGAHLPVGTLEADLQAHALVDPATGSRGWTGLARAIAQLIDNAQPEPGSEPNLAGPLRLLPFPPDIPIAAEE